jgi:Spy/CpxP family protein refolding chaperone
LEKPLPSDPRTLKRRERRAPVCLGAAGRLAVLQSGRAFALLSLVVLLVLPVRTVPAAALDDNLYNYLQLLRSDFNSVKVELVNGIMKLSAEDAKKFWPIYREYENELGEQAVRRAEFIAEFVQSHADGTFDNARAKEMAKRWFKAQRARLDLLQKYHTRIEKALSPVQAGQFLQIENQIGLFIDVTIASEMPRVGETKK